MELSVFILDERLKNDTVCLGQFPLSLLLMSRDANYPWCILVPRREGVKELYELGDGDIAQLVKESRHLSLVLMALFQGDKLNVAALGNMVPQLHLHHIVRHRGDAAWPGAVWGAVPALAFSTGSLVVRARDIQSCLVEGFVPDPISD
jgi:diadenosine tetraphosphate (Ap4A) HIT family hydrolase